MEKTTVVLVVVIPDLVAVMVVKVVPASVTLHLVQVVAQVDTPALVVSEKVIRLQTLLDPVVAGVAELLCQDIQDAIHQVVAVA
jgi:hypothetical protein